MSNRYGTAARRAAAGGTAVALALLLSACGGGGEQGGDDRGKASENAGSASSAPPDQSTPTADGGGPTVPDTSATLATINGSSGFQFVIHSAVRDQGGFLTVTGSLKNTSSKMLIAPPQWSGQEVSVKQTGPSLAGITLLDKTEKKRYYVLRDTEGYPLTTTGITTVKAGGTVSVFAQFPAPPANVTQVDIQIPQMPVATIEIS